MFLKNFQNLEFPGILPVPGNTRKESGYLFPQLKNNFPELTDFFFHTIKVIIYVLEEFPKS